MRKLLFISDNKIKIDEIDYFAKKNHFHLECIKSDIQSFDDIDKLEPDLIILDCEIKDVNTLCKKLKFFLQAQNILLILLVNNDFNDTETLKTANAFLQEPVSEAIFTHLILSVFNTKNTLDTLSKNNSELARSLYQLNTLYNTSYQLAGSLDKFKLVNIMNDGLQKSLSYSLSYTFVINEDGAILTINSLNALTERFEQAIKLRALLSYNSLFSNKKLPTEVTINSIKVIKNIKYNLKEYDLNVFNFDNLFAPINLENNFFGLIEVFRENEFTQEDATCFQTLTKQVSLPLESASLYDEIKKTNLKLEKLEKLKSDFISIVSHELRTPLTSIKNSLDIILGGKAGEITANTDKFLNLAKRNVTRLSAIINDLLDLSKIEAEKMEYRYDKINVLQPVEFVKNTLENLAKEKNINLSLSVNSDIHEIYADLQKIEQIMTNLISNAIKFTPENGSIDINIDEVDAKDLNLDLRFDKYIKISVKDTGIGILDEDKQKVFDKFQQIENSLSRKTGGTGLGLPIAKELTEAHLGKIWLDSEVNVGSTFTVIFPVVNDEIMFILNLKRLILKHKTDMKQVSLIRIDEPVENNIFISDFLENTDILYSNINQHLLKTVDDYNSLFITVIDEDKKITDLIKAKLITYINNKNFDKKCDILYSTVNSINDSDNAIILLEKSKDNLKKIV